MSGVQKGIKIAAIVLAIFIICIIINAILALVGSFAYAEGDITFLESYKDISNIEIDLNTTNLEIKKGVEFKVEASNVTDKFHVRKRHNTLYIEEDSFWLFGNNNAGKVIVYVPEYLNELNIDTGAGETSIDSISAKEFTLDYGAGVININNSEFSNAEIDGGTGTININNTILTNSEIDTGVGEVNINGQLLGRSSINSGIGKLNINLTGGESLYELRLDKGIGSITLNGLDYDKSSYGNGINIINIDGGIGEIDINFS